MSTCGTSGSKPNSDREHAFTLLLNSEVLRRAFVRSIEVIGEATKNVPEDFRARHPHIDWRLMAGMRDRLVHAYFGIDYDIVWDVAANRATTLKHDIEQILAHESADGS